MGDVELRWRAGLRATEIGGESIPSIIDELPVLAVVAALAAGVTRIRGAAELRVKESDRIAVMAAGLQGLGFRVRAVSDGMDIEGKPGGHAEPAAATTQRPLELDAAGDHRCAMSFAVLAQVLGRPVRIRGTAEIATSYPEFVAHLCGLGGAVMVEKETAHA